MKKILVSAAAIGAIALGGLAAAAPAQALACGTPALYISGVEGGSNYLWVRGANGALLDTVPMTGEDRTYGDIALSVDAQTIYGVQYTGAFVDFSVIDLVDPTTGEIKDTLTMTGPATAVTGWVGAAIVGDGKLVIGSNSSPQVFKVDVTSGVSTLFADYEDLGPNDYYSTGDFAQLPGGDVLALVTDDTAESFFLVRIAADGTPTIVGEVDQAYGAGRVGDDIQFAQADGFISKIAVSAIPTVAGIGALTLTTVVDTGNTDNYGAAGTEDSGEQKCAAALPDTGISSSTAITLGLIGAGLGLAGAAGLVIARRKTA